MILHGNNLRGCQGAVGTYTTFVPLENHSAISSQFPFLYVKPNLLNNLPSREGEKSLINSLKYLRKMLTWYFGPAKTREGSSLAVQPPASPWYSVNYFLSEISFIFALFVLNVVYIKK